jgi:hypothetical protein
MVGLRSSHSFFYDARDNLTRLPDRLIFLVTLRKLEPPPFIELSLPSRSVESHSAQLIPLSISIQAICQVQALESTKVFLRKEEVRFVKLAQ